MCGLFAAITNDSDLIRSLNLHLIESAMASRGPDSIARYASDREIFCHSLLSISSSGEHIQPYTDDSLVLLFNGEIYNYRDLAETLSMDCENLTETKVVFEFIKRKGVVKFCEIAIGMFAIIFHDKKSKVTYLCRDYFGQKPLYYHCSENSIFVASQQTYIKAALPTNSVSFDNHELRSAITLGFNNVGRSLFKGVHAVERGQIIEFKECKVTRSFFYTPTTDDEAVSICAQSTFGYTPYLSFSGGIDSSYVAAQFASRKPSNFVPVSLISDQPHNPDRNRIETVAKQLKISPDILVVRDEELARYAEIILNANCDPILDPGAPLSYALLSYVSKDTRIVLGGDGGDEIYFGYSRMIKIQKLLSSVSYLPKRVILILGKLLYGYAIGGFAGICAIKLHMRERANERLVQTLEIDHFLQQVLAKNDIISLLTGVEYRSPLLSYSRLLKAHSTPVPLDTTKSPISLFPYKDKAGFDVYDKFKLVDYLTKNYHSQIQSLELRLGMRFKRLSYVERFRFISVALFIQRLVV